MAVIPASQKDQEPKIIKKHTKPYKTRPITATLEHPLILDIKLLKKLDMTTFTKKGLIALSKFCGISLINRTETKKKLKTIQCSKKQLGTESTDSCISLVNETKSFKTRRKTKKATPRVLFKANLDEDASDVVCKTHNKVLKSSNRKLTDKESIIDGLLNDNIIPEPCKTCIRSECPERFHSHPKMLTKVTLQQKTHGGEQFKSTTTPKHKTKKEFSSSDSENRLSQDDEHSEKKTPSKLSSKSVGKSNSSTGLSSPESGSKTKPKVHRNPITSSSSLTKVKKETPKHSNNKSETSQRKENTNTSVSVEENMKFVTGCYICGQQLSPKSRMKHEKSCIIEWRTRNSVISPDKRKPEPTRPDFRFTASGDLDCEGTFESIWANHMDSLVPCKKCGRKFFPDRIEKHENCCNNLPLNVKYKH